MSNPSKTRAVREGPDHPVAQIRRELYKEAIGKVNGAIEHEFYLEAVTLIESMIADRLEARLAALHEQRASMRQFDTLHNLINKLKKKEPSENELCFALYDEVDQWRERRNRALHQIVKHAENETRSWHDKYAEAKQAAIDGYDLFRRLDRETAKHNRPS